MHVHGSNVAKTTPDPKLLGPLQVNQIRVNTTHKKVFENGPSLTQTQKDEN